MMAVWSARVARWRSTQLWQTLSSPSSYQRMLTSPSNEVFLIRVGFLNQSSRSAISAQKPCGSCTERSYMARYLAPSQWLLFAQLASTGSTSDISPLRQECSERLFAAPPLREAYSHAPARARNAVGTFCRNGAARRCPQACPQLTDYP